ncbi:MAG: aminotransferase class IV [Phycisphaerales bacterium]
MLAYVNGAILPQEEATVSILDRGFLLGDGVYEFVRYFDGVGAALDLHEARLARSLRLARIEGFDARELGRIGSALLAANNLRDGGIYLQVTRGRGPGRVHMPTPGLVPTVVALATPSAPLSEFTRPEPMRAIVRPDMRWHHCAIKTISLAGNVLALMEAQAAGVDECILVRDGFVGEGAYTNVAVVHDGAVATCPLDDDASPVLHGTMRAWMVQAAQSAGVPLEVRRVRAQELESAQEVLVLSSRRLVSGVVELDGRPVGDGNVGPVCHRLFAGMRALLTGAR